MPAPAEQYRKTPAYIRVIDTLAEVKDGGEYPVIEMLLTKTVNGEEVPATLADTDLPEEEKHAQARWGLGCPGRCGRFWEFRPNEALNGFVPVDIYAQVGEDETGKLTKGYLRWTENKDGSASFYCDRCGTQVELSPPKEVTEP